MPSIQENMRLWGKRYDWSSGGDEWSSPWGGPEAQWYWVLLPRIHAFVPTEAILEIGPGFGRWTHYLKELGTSLAVVDVNGRCIDACRKRFAGEPHLRYYVNDGMSLPVEDASVDFAFSFDSLVHAEDDVMRGYLDELGRTLRPTGAAFLHHSNLAALDATPTHTHWRGASVSASSVRREAEAAGLVCVSQELVNFGDRYVGYGEELIDCFTTVCGPDSPFAARPTTLVENGAFMEHSQMVSRVAPLYDREPAAATAPPREGRLRRLLRHAVS